MSKIFGKPYAEAFVESLPATTRQSFADALNDNGDFLRVDLYGGTDALEAIYDEGKCDKCALSYGKGTLEGVIAYTDDEEYDFVSYEPQDAVRFWKIDVETCELTEVKCEPTKLVDLRLALTTEGAGSSVSAPAVLATLDADATIGAALSADGTKVEIGVEGLPYTTTAPTEDNEDGTLKIVVLDEEPASKYAGYFYFITEE